MRFIATALLATLVACGGAEEPAPKPAPEPAPAPAPEPAPEPEAKEEAPDLAAMSEEDRMAWLMKEGENVYKTGGTSGIACMTCHMENGEGQAGIFPPLKGAGDFMGDCTKHAGYVIKGLNGEIEVNGVKYNGAMPPQPGLSDIELAAVLTYERNSWGNELGPCMPEDVAKAR
ncbi:MAG: cytochrome c [Deltaproteobacteria bacterium]|nr:MAG: cytochrome c [Deltaproteobacteria bacterium]